MSTSKINVGQCINFNNPKSLTQGYATTLDIVSYEVGKDTTTIGSSLVVDKPVTLKGTLVLNTDSATKLTSQFWLAHSDRRIKTNIRTAEDSPELAASFQKYRVVKYHYAAPFVKKFGYSDREQIGLIADEVLESHPHMVEVSAEPVHDLSEFKTVDPHSLFYEMVVLVQGHTRRILELERNISSLRASMSTQN